MEVRASWANDALKKYERQIARLSVEFPKVIPQEINKVGNRAKTVVIRNLTKQTGLDKRVIIAAVGDPIKAGRGKLSYDMRTRGGNIRLKYLHPVEKGDGVDAKPFGKKVHFSGAFMMGGKVGERKVVELFKGHVMRRTKGRFYTFQRSGVVIPDEMTSGATLKAFHDIADPLLKQRIEKVLNKLAP